MLSSTCPCGGCAPHGLGRRAALGLGAFLALGLPAARAAGPAPHTTLDADAALRLMKEGNDAYRSDAPIRFAHGPDRLHELAQGQSPFCVVVGCSDSRVPPELLFSRGLGELFIVRNAGNTVDTAALGSIEYGVGVLGCPLVVVLGHRGCGAVSAAVDVVERNATFPGVIGEMVQPIIPAVLSARAAGRGSLDDAVEANTRRVAGRLRMQSAVLGETARAGRLRIVGARYDLEDGHVEWFEDV